MDIGLFVLGAFGALVIVYLAKEEIIPEFRPLFDTAEKEKEALEHREHIGQTEKHIDALQDKLEREALSNEEVTRLKIGLETSLAELKDERARLQKLEREMKHGQVLSRSLGFFFYILLGGFVAMLLADKIKVEGLSGELPAYFQAVVIGATWMSFLSTLGLRTGQRKADETIEAGLTEAGEKLKALKQELKAVVNREVAQVEEALPGGMPGHADRVNTIMDEMIQRSKEEIEKSLMMTRKMAQWRAKSVL